MSDSEKDFLENCQLLESDKKFKRTLASNEFSNFILYLFIVVNCLILN